MIHKCRCTLCELSRVSQGSQIDGCDQVEQPKGTPKEILENANRIVDFSRDTGDSHLVASITARTSHTEKKGGIAGIFTYNVRLLGTSVEMEILFQHSAYSKQIASEKDKSWLSPDDFGIISSMHVQLSMKAAYILGAWKEGPFADSRLFSSKSAAGDYFVALTNALEWFAQGPAKAAVDAYRDKQALKPSQGVPYGELQLFSCTETKEPVLKPIEMYSCPVIDENGAMIFHVPGIFKCIVELKSNTVVFEVLWQHEALYANTLGPWTTWLTVDDFSVVSKTYVQLGQDSVYLKGRNDTMPDRVVRIFKNDNQAAVYRHSLVRALDRFMAVAKSHVAAFEQTEAESDHASQASGYDREEALAKEHEAYERQHAPGLHGRQGFLTYHLIKTNRRLTFDIVYQHPLLTYDGDDDGDYYTYHARNGIEIISRSRMDVQTDRLWLRGGTVDDRSGSMVFSDNAKRDLMYTRFQVALTEWFQEIAGPAVRDGLHICNK